MAMFSAKWASIRQVRLTCYCFIDSSSSSSFDIRVLLNIEDSLEFVKNGLGVNEDKYKELADKYKALKQGIDDELKAYEVQTIIWTWRKHFQPRQDTSTGKDRKRQCDNRPKLLPTTAITSRRRLYRVEPKPPTIQFSKKWRRIFLKIV